MIYNEQKQRGTDDFPIEYHYIDENHPRYIMQLHWHTEVELIRVISGKLDITLNNTSMVLSPGDIVFVNPDTVHGAMPYECVYECVVFDPTSVLNSCIEAINFAISLKNHHVFVYHKFHENSTEIINASNNVFASFMHECEFYRLKTIAYIYMFFEIILKNKLYSSRSEFASFLKDKNIIKLKRAIEYIRNNYNDKLTLHELSKAVNVSPKYLCSFFSQMTGMTVFEYLNAYRIEQASKELISTDKLIIDIAFGCGFNDLSYFIKTFKKYKGVTPKAFRNAHFR